MAASSATTERRFSSLRRLKTYLRSTCEKWRLNSLAKRLVHKHMIDSVNLCTSANERICRGQRHTLTNIRTY